MWFTRVNKTVELWIKDIIRNMDLNTIRKNKNIIRIKI